jgi:hypothetical protein
VTSVNTEIGAIGMATHHLGCAVSGVFGCGDVSSDDDCCCCCLSRPTCRPIRALLGDRQWFWNTECRKAQDETVWRCGGQTSEPTRHLWHTTRLRGARVWMNTIFRSQLWLQVRATVINWIAGDFEMVTTRKSRCGCDFILSIILAVEKGESCFHNLGHVTTMPLRGKFF